MSTKRSASITRNIMNVIKTTSDYIYLSESLGNQRIINWGIYISNYCKNNVTAVVCFHWQQVHRLPTFASLGTNGRRCSLNLNQAGALTTYYFLWTSFLLGCSVLEWKSSVTELYDDVTQELQYRSQDSSSSCCCATFNFAEVQILSPVSITEEHVNAVRLIEIAFN